MAHRAMRGVEHGAHRAKRGVEHGAHRSAMLRWESARALGAWGGGVASWWMLAG